MFVEGSQAECHSVLAGGETVFINSILLTYEPLHEAHSEYLCPQVQGGYDSTDVIFPVSFALLRGPVTVPANGM